MISTEQLRQDTHQQRQAVTRNAAAITKNILNDEDAYAQSIGKETKTQLGEMHMNQDGTGTVVRLFYGATANMPVRGLSYITSALRIAAHIPHEQLQVIFANDLGCGVNGIDRQIARKQAELLSGVGRALTNLVRPGLEHKVLFGEDVAIPLIDQLEPSVARLIASNQSIAEKLNAKGSKHSGDHIRYAAAHIVYQETDSMSPIGLTQDEPGVVKPDRVVSIGCQQEHLFYKLRMLARKSLADEVTLIPSAQVFTKHVLPPYYMARGGEQSLEHAIANRLNIELTSDASARRDLFDMAATTDLRSVGL